MTENYYTALVFLMFSAILWACLPVFDGLFEKRPKAGLTVMSCAIAYTIAGVVTIIYETLRIFVKA